MCIIDDSAIGMFDDVARHRPKMQRNIYSKDLAAPDIWMCIGRLVFSSKSRKSTARKIGNDFSKWTENINFAIRSAENIRCNLHYLCPHVFSFFFCLKSVGVLKNKIYWRAIFFYLNTGQPCIVRRIAANFSLNATQPTECILRGFFDGIVEILKSIRHDRTFSHLMLFPCKLTICLRLNRGSSAIKKKEGNVGR